MAAQTLFTSLIILGNIHFFIVKEPGRVPCALKCTLILTSDLVKGWYGHLKKLVTHVRSGPISAILKSKMAAIQNLIFSKKLCVHGRYVYQIEALTKENIYQDHLD